MERKWLLRRKLTIPCKSDISPLALCCCAAPGGPCCVLLNLSIALILYIRITWVLSTYDTYTYRLRMYALHWTYLHNEKRHSLWLIRLSLFLSFLRDNMRSLAFCCYYYCCSLLLVFIHFVSYRSFLARRLDGFYGKFHKLFSFLQSKLLRYKDLRDATDCLERSRKCKS